MFPLLFLGFYAVSTVASPTLFSPKVTLDHGTFTGVSGLITNQFLGIPFAKPPVGNLRYNLPQPIAPYVGNYDATKFGLACPQQSVTIPAVSGLASAAADFIANSLYAKVFPDSEDCLTLNVIKPAFAGPTSRLPVVVWIFGGGFEIGTPATYDGGVIVGRSIAMGQPVIYVSMNYRLTGFGFLAGKEVEKAKIGNLGLHDQREALRWVQKYISNFGGDPAKVTIFGESAGGISVSLHMLANGGTTDGLFRGGFMMSGAPIPVGGLENGQRYYDALVKDAGCSGAKDTLACLRTVPYQKLKAAINRSPSIFSYQSLNLAWLPRRDGIFLTDNPQRLVQQGKIANIPYIAGNCDDEGTLFSFSTLNITTDEELKKWIQTSLFIGVPDAEVKDLMRLYPSDVREGSPFDTGRANALTPQFKRIAAFQGDGVFGAPRRWLMENSLRKNPNIWFYLSKRLKFVPFVGSAHSSDLLNLFTGAELAGYLIRFANNLDPNPSFGLQWPRYDLQSRSAMTFVDFLPPSKITQDTYRRDAMRRLTEVTLAHPV